MVDKTKKCQFKDGVYFVMRFSQIKANILGLKVSNKEEETKIIFIDVKPVRRGQENMVEENDVRKQVMEIWDTRVKKYYISEIHFAPNDSPSESIYKELTRSIINCLIEQSILPEITEIPSH